jgi:hypothetical protein
LPLRTSQIYEVRNSVLSALPLIIQQLTIGNAIAIKKVCLSHRLQQITNLEATKDAEKLSGGPEDLMAASVSVHKDFGNATAYLKRTADAVDAACRPDLTQTFPKLGPLILVPRESRC